MHTVSYTYAPSSVRNGAILSGVGLLATFVGLFASFFWKPGKRRRPQKEERPEDMESAASTESKHPEVAVSTVGGKERDEATGILDKYKRLWVKG